MAQLVGCSRSTLLYYERLGLIQGRREPNGYRVYEDEDLQRLRLVQVLADCGLSLRQINDSFSRALDADLIERKIQELSSRIERLRLAKDLLEELVGTRSGDSLYGRLAQEAPEALVTWLKAQGYEEKEAQWIRWLSKDMSEHEQYMRDFFEIYKGLDNWGPGSEKDTLKALALIDLKPERILEIGCGTGRVSILLANNTQAHITSVDNEMRAIEALQASCELNDLTDRIEPVCASMSDLPFEDGSFDLIVCEGAAYIMGFPQALGAWKRLLTDQGCMIISDLVYLSNTPCEKVAAFWKNEYPHMSTVSEREEQIRSRGYTILDQFDLDRESWDAYICPLEQRISELRTQLGDSKARKDLLRELEIYRQYLDSEFSYHIFVLKRGRVPWV